MDPQAMQLDPGSNDLVWAIRSEDDQHHWREGRIVQQPKKFLETGRPLLPAAAMQLDPAPQQRQ